MASTKRTSMSCAKSVAAASNFAQPFKRSCKPLPLLTSSLWLSPAPEVQNGSRLKTKLCAAILPFAAVTAAAQPAAVAAAAHWPAVLTSCGVFTVCCAAAALLLSAIPLLWSMARTANRMESMLQTLEAELPDTAASMRLSSLELSDCLNELGALGNDLSSGVRASALLISSAETGVRQGAQLIGTALVPALARRETKLRDAIEAALKVRAALAPEIPKARAAVVATTVNARRARGALLLTRFAGAAVNMGRALRARLGTAAAQRLAEEQALAAAQAVAVKRWQQQQQQQQRRGQSQQQQRPA